MPMEQRSSPLSLYHVQSNETSMEKVDRWTIHAVTLAFPPASRAKFACCHARAVHLAGVVPGARGVRPRAARRCLLGALRRAVPARGTAAWRCRAPLWRAPRVGGAPRAQLRAGLTRRAAQLRDTSSSRA